MVTNQQNQQTKQEPSCTFRTSPKENNIFFKNVRQNSCSWLSTHHGNCHHADCYPSHLSTVFQISPEAIIWTQDPFNGGSVNPLICISGDLIYENTTDNMEDPIKILLKKPKKSF